MKPAIRIQHVSKHFQMGEVAPSSFNLQENLVSGLRSCWNRLRGVKAERRQLWALKDVSFDVRPGEVLGVIGRNGAGKSTLLKVLSRVTEPSSGRAELRGRLGSLLEVGTGFHPELSGRENIYLNGSLIGMSRAEIRRQFDEIVAFAEIAEFLDTPVKRYSSGMYVRLAFAIAAHLQPEILILDEVLAVGDAMFQTKCASKMAEVSHQGRTILLVSHDLATIRRVCDRAVWLDRGEVKLDGTANDVADAYLADHVEHSRPGQTFDLTNTSRFGSLDVRFVRVVYYGNESIPGAPVHTHGPLRVRFTLHADVRRTVDSISVLLIDRSGLKLLNADSICLGKPVQLQPGDNELEIRIKSVPLHAGTYLLGLFVARRPLTVFDRIESACEIEVLDDPMRKVARPNPDAVVSCEYELDPLNVPLALVSKT
jgi:lipopolysaccharide transport system ATP-binding protein